ncbi:unnamed protein product [Enterobius vermicularis]|uniref:Dolichyl-phosphate-mannose--protein mannosyltransferase n=1 Tax=Enterobius vermicularis TaxID=51028 RepID=A0A0N4UXC9_ENTVE|nr:unnamed protein product [Enterobius vermicularis]
MLDDNDYFLGEDYRCCFRILHIVVNFFLLNSKISGSFFWGLLYFVLTKDNWGLRTILLADIILTTTFQLLLPLKFGYFDAFCITQLCITATTVICALLTTWKQRRDIVWPYIFYKVLAYTGVLFILLSFLCRFVCLFILLSFLWHTNNYGEWVKKDVH